MSISVDLLDSTNSSPVSRTKALKTTSFQGFFLSSEPSAEGKLRAGFLEENPVGRIRMKQVEGLGNVTLETAIEEFPKSCRLLFRPGFPDAHVTGFRISIEK